MIDLALFVFIMALLALGARRPYLWVLTYIYIDILTPQRIGWTLTPALPLSLIAFCAAFAGWLAVDSKRGTRVSVRQILMVMLLIYAFFSTGWADFPGRGRAQMELGLEGAGVRDLPAFHPAPPGSGSRRPRSSWC